MPYLYTIESILIYIILCELKYFYNLKGKNMKFKDVLLGSALMSSMLFAGGDIVPVEPIVQTPIEETDNWELQITPLAIY